MISHNSVLSNSNVLLFISLSFFFSNLFVCLVSYSLICQMYLFIDLLFLIIWMYVLFIYRCIIWNYTTVWHIRKKITNYTQAKSPRMNFTWNEFHVNFSREIHVKFASREFHVKLVSREIHINFSRELQVSRVSHEIHLKYVPIFHVKFVGRNLFKSFNFN